MNECAVLDGDGAGGVEYTAASGGYAITATLSGYAGGDAAGAGAPLAPLCPKAAFESNVTFVSVILPLSLSKPAPSPNISPFAIERPLIETVVPKTSSSRSRRLALRIVLPAPAPLIVRFRRMSRSPVAALFSFWPKIVCVNVPAGTMMVSGRTEALAA